MNPRPTVVVTQSAALVDYLCIKGIVDRDVRIVSTPTPEAVYKQDVIGELPLRVACFARSVTDVPVRGLTDRAIQDLPLEDIQRYAGDPVTYRVTVVLRSLDVPHRADLVVTSNPEFVDYLREIGLVEKGVELTEEAKAPLVYKRHVVGNLSIRLAALTKSLTQIPLPAHSGEGAQMLTLTDYRRLAGAPVTYYIKEMVHSGSHMIPKETHPIVAFLRVFTFVGPILGVLLMVFGNVRLGFLPIPFVLIALVGLAWSRRAERKAFDKSIPPLGELVEQAAPQSVGIDIQEGLTEAALGETCAPESRNRADISEERCQDQAMTGTETPQNLAVPISTTNSRVSEGSPPSEGPEQPRRATGRSRGRRQNAIPTLSLWIGATVVAVAIVAHAVLPRYRVEHVQGLRFAKIDRWTGAIELVSPSSPKVGDKARSTSDQTGFPGASTHNSRTFASTQTESGSSSPERRYIVRSMWKLIGNPLDYDSGLSPAAQYLVEKYGAKTDALRGISESESDLIGKYCVSADETELSSKGVYFILKYGGRLAEPDLLSPEAKEAYNNWNNHEK